MGLVPRSLLSEHRREASVLGIVAARMAWNARDGEGEFASEVSARYTTVADTNRDAIGGASNTASASAYFLPTKGTRHHDPTAHVIARQARRTVYPESDYNACDAVRYIRSLRYLPKEQMDRGSHRDYGLRDSRENTVSENTSTAASSHATTNGIAPFRFPATRSVMWDTSPVGQLVQITAHAHAPVVCFDGSATKQIDAFVKKAKAKATKGGVASVNVYGTFHSGRPGLDERGEPVASTLLELTGVGSSAGEGCDVSGRSTSAEIPLNFTETWSAPASVSLTSLSPAETETLDTLRTKLETQCAFIPENIATGDDTASDDVNDVNDEINEVMSRHVNLTTGAVWPVRVAASKSENNQLVVSIATRTPTAMFSMAPIAPPRMADSPLHRELMEHSNNTSSDSAKTLIKTGYLTMDQTRRLICLDELESRAYGTPLVGCWVSGVSNPTHLAVWSSCCRFVNSSALSDKAFQRGAFLCVVYPPGDEKDEENLVSRKIKAKQPVCFDVSVVKKGGKKFADFAAEFVCVPGEPAQAKTAPVASLRVERKATAVEETLESSNSGPVKLKRFGSPEEQRRGDKATPSPSTIQGGLHDIAMSSTKHNSPEWAPLYGSAPRTPYETAAAISAARAAAANAKLAARAGVSSPSGLRSGARSPYLQSPAARSPVKPSVIAQSLPPGAARLVVEEQQRVIQALTDAVETLQSEMFAMSDGGELSDGSRLRVRESRARDLMGGLRGYGFTEDKGAYGYARRQVAVRGSPKSPLSKALAYGRAVQTGEVDNSFAEYDVRDTPPRLTTTRVTTHTTGTSTGELEVEEGVMESVTEGVTESVTETSDPSPELSAKELKCLKKQQKKDAKKGKKNEKKEKKGVAKEPEEPEATEAPPEMSEMDAKAAEELIAVASELAEEKALGYQQGANEVVSNTKTKAGYPETPDGIPQDVPEPPPGMPNQPNRRFSESPYVESVEDEFEKGNRVADPLPGGNIRYPAQPQLAHASTGYEFADSDDDALSETANTPAALNALGSDSETELETLLNLDLMVDPTTMEPEYAARAAAACRRDALSRLRSSHDRGEAEETQIEESSNGVSPARADLLRQAVRAGYDPMFPVIDYSFELEGGDDLDEQVDDIVERYDEGELASAGEDEDEDDA